MNIETYLDTATNQDHSDHRVKHEEVMHPVLGVMVDRDAVDAIDAVVWAGYETQFSCGGDSSGRWGYVSFYMEREQAHILADFMANSEMKAVKDLQVLVQERGTKGATSVVIRWGYDQREVAAHLIGECLKLFRAVLAIAATVSAPTA